MSSFVPECHEGIDAGGAAGRNVAGDERHETEQGATTPLGERIGRLHAEQLTAQQPRGGEAGRDADGEPGQHEPSAHPSISPSTWRRGAPSAMRTPSSCVRRVTWNDRTL